MKTSKRQKTQVPNRSHRTENTITELKNTLEGFKSRLDDDAKKGSVNLKTGQWNSPIREAKKEKKRKKGEDSLRDNVKQTTIHIKRVPEGEGRDKGAENILEQIMTEGNRHSDPGQP